MGVNPKIAQKRDFVYKSNANCVFSINSHKNSYFYCTCLKLIYFSIIMLQKMFESNFSEKNNKNKRSKNIEIHKKFKKTIKYIGNNYETKFFLQYYCLGCQKEYFNQKLEVFELYFAICWH